MHVTSFTLHNLTKTEAVAMAVSPGGESGGTLPTTRPPVTSSVRLHLSGVWKSPNQAFKDPARVHAAAWTDACYVQLNSGVLWQAL